MAGSPLRIKPLQMRFKRTLTGSEDVRAPATQYSTDKAAAVAAAPHDLLDCDPVFGQAQNSGVGLFSAQIALVLDSLGCGKKLGIDRRGTNHAADLSHRFLNSFNKGTTRILHEMPTVSDLGSVRQRPRSSQCIAAATIACHNHDLGLVGKPSLGGRRFAVRQQRHWLASFKIADDRAVALVSFPSPIVDTHHAWPGTFGTTAASDNPKKCIVTHRNHEPPRKARRRAAPERQAEVVNHIVQPGCSPRPRCQNVASASFGKDLPTTKNGTAAEAPRYEDQPNRAARQRQIRDAP